MGLVIEKQVFSVRTRHKAFTLIELLVVISIIALLLSILMPALGSARQHAKAVFCLTNLRQFAMAALYYVDSNKGYLPPAYADDPDPFDSKVYLISWDFIHITDNSTGSETIESGLLWDGQKVPEEIQQCPSFKGNANWQNDPYTGYNYNTSYIGQPPVAGPFARTVKLNRIKHQDACALFGDGQYSGGANKFMRAPLIDYNDNTQRDRSFSGRAAGTQGFRHNQATNVAYCDGHADAVRICCTNTIPTEINKIAEETGFLSEDNSAYDLK